MTGLAVLDFLERFLLGAVKLHDDVQGLCACVGPRNVRLYGNRFYVSPFPGALTAYVLPGVSKLRSDYLLHGDSTAGNSLAKSLDVVDGKAHVRL